MTLPDPTLLSRFGVVSLGTVTTCHPTTLLRALSPELHHRRPDRHGLRIPPGFHHQPLDARVCPPLALALDVFLAGSTLPAHIPALVFATIGVQYISFLRHLYGQPPALNYPKHHIARRRAITHQHADLSSVGRLSYRTPRLCCCCSSPILSGNPEGRSGCTTRCSKLTAVEASGSRIRGGGWDECLVDVNVEGAVLVPSEDTM